MYRLLLFTVLASRVLGKNDQFIAQNGLFITIYHILRYNYQLSEKDQNG